MVCVGPQLQARGRVRERGICAGGGREEVKKESSMGHRQGEGGEVDGPRGLPESIPSASQFPSWTSLRVIGSDTVYTEGRNVDRTIKICKLW